MKGSKASIDFLAPFKLIKTKVFLFKQSKNLGLIFKKFLIIFLIKALLIV